MDSTAGSRDLQMNSIWNYHLQMLQVLQADQALGPKYNEKVLTWIIHETLISRVRPRQLK
ncbi:hypothetical protein NC651_026565 [Populus alba x Populus x berolinensis]|nr:hypothetical protein NC651_026565 [Populus alba x Populus x berolinensis]